MVSAAGFTHRRESLADQRLEQAGVHHHGAYSNANASMSAVGATSSIPSIIMKVTTIAILGTRNVVAR